MELEMNISGDEEPAGQKKDPELDFIVVNASKWEIKCPGSNLEEIPVPLRRRNIKPFILWGRSRDNNPKCIEICDENKQSLYQISIPESKDGLGDVLMALLVDRDHNKWVEGQGKLWTEFGISLFQMDGSDYMCLDFEVKWNITLSPYDIPQISHKPNAISKVLSTYFPDPNVQNSEAWSAQDFYQSVHTPSKNDDGWEYINSPDLETSLYPFQKRTVKWMLRREATATTPDLNPDLPISFIKAQDSQGRSCFVSHLFGVVTLDTAPFQKVQDRLKGGILAEEMGLGKTVEIISLITLHKRPPEEPIIFDEWTGEKVRPTSATLIISPPAILQQWISEINKHAPHLKVMHYEGINAHSRLNDAELIDQMAASHVVISTYSVLAAEVFYTQLNPEKSLRRAPKYPRPRSGLMQLSWWRVC